jgi:hypothetical protein
MHQPECTDWSGRITDELSFEKDLEGSDRGILE